VTVGSFTATGASGSMIEFRHGGDDDILVTIASAEQISGTASFIDLAATQRSTIVCGMVKGFTSLFTSEAGSISFRASFVIDTPIIVYASQTICVDICSRSNSPITENNLYALIGRVGGKFYNMNDWDSQEITADTDLSTIPRIAVVYIDASSNDVTATLEELTANLHDRELTIKRIDNSINTASIEPGGSADFIEGSDGYTPSASLELLKGVSVKLKADNNNLIWRII